MKNEPLLSFVTRQIIENIGQNVKVARQRRGESLEMAATRAGVTRQTWTRLEAGNPNVSLGLAIEALELYGFARQLFTIGDPALDSEGAARDAARRPKRGAKIQRSEQ